jgi:hypothetical protein
MSSESRPTPVLSRTLAWVVLAVMALSLVYTGWIALSNFSQIGV